MSPVRILLSASFPRVSLQFRPWQRHLIAATDSSQTPCKLLPASCVRFLSMSRQRPLGVLSASSQSSLGLLSASSHCFSARMYCLDSHVEPWRPLRTSSHRRRTRRSLHAFIIFPALRVHIPRLPEVTGRLPKITEISENFENYSPGDMYTESGKNDEGMQ